MFIFDADSDDNNLNKKTPFNIGWKTHESQGVYELP